MSTHPSLLLLNVTNRCNLSCPYCFGPEQSIKDPTVACLQEDIERAKEEGYKAIIFSGGEPLLREETADLIRFAKELGLTTILHTNGILVTEEYISDIEKYLDQINIPIDASIEKINSVFRGSDQLYHALESLEYLKDCDIKIVVSTVVTSRNYDNVLSISTIIPNHIYKWRVLQFKVVEKNKSHAALLKISKSRFTELCKKLKKLNVPYTIQCVPADDRKFYSSYKEL